MKPVLVLDADTDQSLAVVRALSENEIPIHVAGSGRRGPGYWSLRAGRRFVYPSPLRFPKEFLAFIQRLSQEEHYEAVFPLTDSTTTVLQQFRSKLSHLPIAMADKESYFKVSDKFHAHEIARAAGLSVPQTFYPNSPSELEAILPKLKFPIMLKPRYSRFYDEQTDTLISGNTRVIFDEQELAAHFAETRQGSVFPCIQAWVPGIGFGVELLMKDQKVIAQFCHRRVREMDPLGSGSSACVSAPPREDLVEASIQMLRSCHYEGTAMVEFRMDETSGKAWFIEINGRFWGTLALPLACGINFPYLYLQAFLRNQPVTVTTDYPIGIQARSLWKETSRFLSILKGRPFAWKGTFPTRGEGVKEYFTAFFKKGQVYCDFQLNDPLPGLVKMLSVFLETLIHVFMRPFQILKGIK